MSMNLLNLEIKDYQGGKSTLCTGCGHDSITKHIIDAYFRSSVHPFKVAKLSGIGCSSKTPAYFMNQSHGFNSIHGRMAPVATGAKMANHQLNIIGISGDGDTASIGLGSFIHLLRRNPGMVYVVENNGVYGLTKGQFSATADENSVQKNGDRNPFQSLDLCSMALEAGCGFVARSFSGDGKQLVALLSAAIRYKGTAFIDVISPCIAYGNQEGSTKSYDYVREHKVSLQELGFIQPKAETKADYAPGEATTIEMADGSTLILKKLNVDHDVTSRSAAAETLRTHREKGEIITGLFYLNQNTAALEERSQLGSKPLAHLGEKELRPSHDFLAKTLREFK